MRFHLGDLLSVSTDRLMSPKHIGGVYEILNHMTGDSLMTHQLPQACEIARPYLMDQHPWLEQVSIPPLSGEADVLGWLATAVEQYGETHEVKPMPHMAWGHHDPIADLQALVGDKPIIAIQT